MDEKREIPDHILQEIVRQCMRIIPDHMTPIGMMKISRTLEREYFRMYLKVFPAHIDEVINVQQENFGAFMGELKQIAADNMNSYKKGGE